MKQANKFYKNFKKFTAFVVRARVGKLGNKLISLCVLSIKGWIFHIKLFTEWKQKFTPKYTLLFLLCSAHSVCVFYMCVCLCVAKKRRKIGYLGKGQWSFLRSIRSIFVLLISIIYIFWFSLPTAYILSFSRPLACSLRHAVYKPDLCFLPMFTSHTIYPFLIKIVLLMHFCNS